MEWNEYARTLLAIDGYVYTERVDGNDPPDSCWHGWMGEHSGKLIVVVLKKNYYTVCEGHRNKVAKIWVDY